EAIGISLPFPLPIVLVIVFRRPPFRLRLDLGDNSTVPIALSPRERMLRFLFLLRVLRADRRSILRADVVALPIQLRRIMRGEKDVEEIGIADLVRIEGDPDCLGVSGAAA